MLAPLVDLVGLDLGSILGRSVNVVLNVSIGDHGVKAAQERVR